MVLTLMLARLLLPSVLKGLATPEADEPELAQPARIRLAQITVNDRVDAGFMAWPGTG